MICAIPANATDNLYCTLLAHSSIHGIMAGYTGFVCGPINGNYAYIPLEEVARATNEVNTRDHKWAWQKIVMKVQMSCQKCRTESLKLVARADGVSFVGLEGAEKDKLVVIGEGVDAVKLATSLRNKVGHTELISVAEQK
ncbi:hypothetical protein LWI28_006456 [Acer negundo]|uniref:Phosphofructokinase n=1 Tax=Acer negundo TaxID=4023 RepID=A0AAD5NIB9_ACENE|nr:hypothetical protein LWI28_006456 [Acer negundo]